MTRFHHSIYALVAVSSIVLAACQPAAESASERVGRDLDQAARQIAQQVDKMPVQRGREVASAVK